MDVISSCLSLTPVPYLAPAFDAFRFLYNSVERAQASKEQLTDLTISIAQLLKTLDNEKDRWIPEKIQIPLDDLRSLFLEIDTFIQKQNSYHFLKVLFFKEERIAKIEGYHRRIRTAVECFQIATLKHLQEWQSRNEAARMRDQTQFLALLQELMADRNRLNDALDIRNNSPVSMMAFLQRHTGVFPFDSQEQRFFSYSLNHLISMSGQEIECNHWMVTSFDVDFEKKIGSGAFSEVYKGAWNKTAVALKVFKPYAGAKPSIKLIRREIEIWAMLSHPNITKFLGANVLDDKPFIMTPFYKHGNARDYILDNPNCDRLRITHGIAQGLDYLHSRRVIHGDIKALNVLIDNDENAVLCDFGLSKIRQDVYSRSTMVDNDVRSGSRNWMAPELFCGGFLRETTDIYSLGMTIFEIYTGELPLGNLGLGDFVKCLTEDHVRPQRPDEIVAPDLTDEIWTLATLCWSQEVSCRPNMAYVCQIITSEMAEREHTALHTNGDTSSHLSHTPREQLLSQRNEDLSTESTPVLSPGPPKDSHLSSQPSHQNQFSKAWTLQTSRQLTASSVEPTGPLLLPNSKTKKMPSSSHLRLHLPSAVLSVSFSRIGLWKLLQEAAAEFNTEAIQYAQRLTSTYSDYGYPLWAPELADNLRDTEYFQDGVTVGDVGILSRDGSFDFLFNTLQPTDHPVNLVHGVPVDFKPLSLPPTAISFRENWKLNGGVIMSGFRGDTRLVKPGTTADSLRWKLTTYHSGAAVFLPDGASRYNCIYAERMKHYALNNAASWWQYAFHGGRSNASGFLVLVTGCDKASSFGLAYRKYPSPSRECSLTFTAETTSGLITCSAESNDVEVISHSSPSGPVGKKNHCLFIRGYLLRRHTRMKGWLSDQINMFEIGSV